jgi:protein-disulfide isomerase
MFYMQPTRRFLMAATAAALVTPGLARADLASADPRMAPRSEGPDDAKVQVEEWFSFTCPHCAQFATEVFPQIKEKLIDTGKIRYIFREYPRDKLDLMCAMVARSLPASRYEPFMFALFATQKHWAYDRSVDPQEELIKMAALAGMSRDAFGLATGDDTLKGEILAAQGEAEQKYHIDSTPTFIINGKPHPGEMTYDQFAALVSAA